MKSLSSIFALGLTALAVGFNGCAKESATSGPETSSTTATDNGHDDHDGHEDHAGHAGHSHPSEGPHDGDLIELGNEEYHAELLHDEDAGTVTIYILDGGATKQVPIDASEITINAKHDGRPEQFSLAASPDESDPQGQSSRFVSNDKELAEHLDEEGADPRLVLTINGKSYRGDISHDHDHADE